MSNPLRSLLGQKPRTFFILSAIFLAINVFNALYIPTIVDEHCITASLYARADAHPSVLLTEYKDPNRHVFYDLLGYFPTKVLGHPYGRRAINLLVSLCFPFVLFALYKRYFNEATALNLLALTLFSFFVLFYSSAGRGYSLKLFFFAWAWLQSLRMLDREKRAAIGYTISVALGYYTMPSFIYAHLFIVVHSIWLLRKRPGAVFKTWVLSNAAAGVTVICLYIPILVHTGYNTIKNISYFKPLESLHSIGLKLYLSAVEFLAFVFEVGYAGVIGVALLAGAGFVLLSRERKRDLLWIFLAVGISAGLLIAYQRVVPFGRNFIYVLIPLILVMGGAVQKISHWTATPYVITLMCILGFYTLGIGINNQTQYAFTLSGLRRTASEGNMRICPCKDQQTAWVAGLQACMGQQAHWKNGTDDAECTHYIWYKEARLTGKIVHEDKIFVITEKPAPE
ncbi:MAG: hypothetical protein KF690_07205 [Bacteroidetes bacterium]|nr:hypothetical protein [Bacteroidota bacterium]